MRVLVFQHIRSEHPGIFREFFDADGVRWDAILGLVVQRARLAGAYPA